MRSVEAVRTAGLRSPAARRIEIERELLAELEAAGKLWRKLRDEYTAARELASAASQVARADGEMLYDRCRALHQAKDAALELYSTALREFNRLILDGEPPGWARGQ